MKNSPIVQWVAAAVKVAGSQAELARLMAEELRGEPDRSVVNKVLKGKRELQADEMLAIEAATKLPLPSPNTPFMVPVIDWVSAGVASEPMSQLPESDADPLPLCGLGPGDFFGLRVKGNSMDRIVPEGAVIVVNRADKTLISGKAYVFSIRGETTFKLWNAEPVYLRSHSWDGSHAPQFVKRKRDLVVVGRAVRSILDL